MPTTKYIDENLRFLGLPSQQWTGQTQYFPGVYSTTGVGSSHGSSSESEFSTSETFHETSNSPLRSPDTTTAEDVVGPYLQFVEPPVESCRFRYPTEMKGTHGSIMGISTLKKENARRKIYPAVKLHNYSPTTPDKKVIIRCTLTTADEDVNSRLPHVHQLKGKGPTSTSQSRIVEIDDPIDIVVSSPTYQATFGNMTILYIKKDDQLEELVKKKKRHIQKMNPYQKLQYPEEYERTLKVEAQRDISKMNLKMLNTACLKFEALEIGNNQIQYTSICPAIFSNPIKNIKSAQFNDLKICRIDKVAGTCLGKEEVFIFVEKVNKKDIRVRFFELNECEEEIWHAHAELGEEDVHFQYAIAFRTPRYKNLEITDNVQVYFQLERPSNGSRSQPKEFEYTPNPDRWRDEVRKRPRRESPPIPTSVQDFSRPSTSSSWDGRRTSLANVFHPPWSSSSSGVTAGSDTSSIEAIKDDYLPELNELFNDFPGLDDIPMDIPQAEPYPSIPSSNPSVTDIISSPSFPSGDSDIILQMSQSDALQKWASCNGVPDNVIQQILSEVTSSVNPQQPSEDGLFVTDGAAGQTEHIEHAEHQSGLVARFQGNIAYPQMEFATESVEAHESYQVQPNNHDRSRLTRDNIVTKVEKIVNGLFNLRRRNKIKDKDMKRFLLETFATSVGVNDDRVLHVLASNPQFPTEMLTFLRVLQIYNIAEKVVNLKNNRGQTPLHLAAEKGSLQTISLLVDKGADVNARDISLNTAIHLMANREQNDSFHAVSHILEKNPDLTIYNEDGLTALHLFVLKRKSDVTSNLLVKSEGEDQNYQVDVINQPDRKQGNTALHMAVQKKFLEIVNLLLNFVDRIDVNAKNFEDKTPLAYVSGETVDDIKMRELLMANNADPALVLDKRDKISKELDEFKNEIENDSLHEYGVEVVEDVDETLPSYAQDWKLDSELKLLDAKTICLICPVLDENQNWAKLLKRLNFDAEDLLLHFLERKWSASLYLLKTVADTMPNVTPEILRDTLIKINPECKKAAQYIDDMILENMGVF